MPWLLLDAVVVLASLLLLAVLVLRLWRRVKALMAEVDRAGQLLGQAGAVLEQVPARGPLDRRPTGGSSALTPSP